MPSPGAWAPEVPCARCGTRVAGLAWGELCRTCGALRQRRASSLARRISLLATLLAGLYLMQRIPPTPQARVYGGFALLVIWLIVRKIVQRVALELLPIGSVTSGRENSA